MTASVHESVIPSADPQHSYAIFTVAIEQYYITHSVYRQKLFTIGRGESAGQLMLTSCFQGIR